MKIPKSSTDAVEFRAAPMSDGTVVGRNFLGNAAVFNVRTAIGNPSKGGFFEQVAEGAFDKSIRDGDVVQLADHDPAKPLSRMSAGSLRLSATAEGLAVDSDLVETTYADDLIAEVNAGLVKGQSFGFQVLQDDWRTERADTGDVEVRTLHEVRLIEVSSTAFPAYASTTADVRSAFEARAARAGGDDLATLLDELRGATELRVGAELSAANMATIQKVCDMLTSMMSGKPKPPVSPPPAAGEAKDGFPLDLAIRYRETAERYGLPILT